MTKKNILIGFTYSSMMLGEVAQRSGVNIILPLQSQGVAKELGMTAVDLPRFGGSKVKAKRKFEKLVAKHDIHAFWPLSSSVYDLSYLTGIPVHAVCKHKTFQMVNDKVTFDSWMTDSRYRPEGVETVGAEKTMKEIRARLEDGQRVCVKPPRGVNGGGFWEISHDANLLANPGARKISPEAFEIEIRKLELKEGMERFLVMEVLTGVELSIDVLCIEGEVLKWMVREKTNNATQIVRSNHEIMAHVRHVVKALRLHGLVSVQYMYDRHGSIKILEINLRPSGGCLAYGEYALGKCGSTDLLTDWLRYMAGMISPSDIEQWKGEVEITIKTTVV